MMLDSFAWMEYFMGTPEGEKAQERTDFIIKRCAVVALLNDTISYEIFLSIGKGVKKVFFL
jgi:hypothetical protein